MSTPAAIVSARTRPGAGGRYRDALHEARALVVDGNPTTRSVLATQLRELGIVQITQCARIAEARSRLETARYDIVLCEQEFPDGGGTGQQLLDDLRRHQLLPLSTVFVMITGEATYAKVAEAAESSLDSYLVKPHNATSLAERIAHARRRKALLGDILAAVDAGRDAEAAELCLERFRARREYWIYAARVGAELLLNLNRHDEARAVYDAVLAARGLPWARLGVARAQIEAGENARAVETLAGLIEEQPAYADAFDVLVRARLELGDFDAAMAAAQRAVALTPDSLPRQQKLGALAYYRGAHDEAARWLERALALGAGSKMFEWQSAVLLALVRAQQRDGRTLQRCVEELEAALARRPQDRRLQRHADVAGALRLWLQQRDADAIARVQRLTTDLDAPDFDVEAAAHVVALLSVLTAAGLEVPGTDAAIDLVAQRHTGSRLLTELLARSAAAHPPHARRIQAGHAQIGRMAEAALAHAVRGQPDEAVRQLLAHARATLNFKLLDTARMTLHRHRGRIPDAPSFDAEIEQLRPLMAPQRSPLVESNGRKPGALVLRRTRPATTPLLPDTVPEPGANGTSAPRAD